MIARRASSAVAVAVVLMGMIALCSASSHSEAPGTSKRPSADATDLYAFRSYETGRSNFVTIIGNFYPLQDPYGGPNYFSFSDSHFYEIYIDNNGDAKEDLTFQMYYGSSLAGPVASTPFVLDEDQCLSPYARALPPSISKQTNGGIALNIGGRQVAVPLKFVGSLSAGDTAALNWNEWYYLNLITGDRTTGNSRPITKAGSSQTKFTKPFDYAGTKTFPNGGYETYARQYIYDIAIPGCATNGRVFAGQRKESFSANLGPIFDLVNLVPIPDFPGAVTNDPKNNALRYKNIASLALELPINCITSSTTDVIGVWFGVRELLHEGDDHIPGRQFSRLGFPLVNEILVGLRDKGLYSRSLPKDDVKNGIDVYVNYPTFPAIVNLLFRDAVNSFKQVNITDLAPNNLPRTDLHLTILTGLPGVNRPVTNTVPADLLRLNTTIAPTAAAGQNSIGYLAGDMAGFPNGRRPGDDVIDVVLRAAMGALCHAPLGICTPANAPVGDVAFLDGAPQSASDFDDFFPYLKTPIPGNFVIDE